MPTQGYDYHDIGGGLNIGTSAAQIQSREFAQLINWYPHATSLRRRGGTRLMTTSNAWDSLITSIAAMRTPAGNWLLIVGGVNKFGRFDPAAGNVVDIFEGDTTIGSSTAPWVFFNYKGYLYALRKNSGRMVRIDGQSALNAGITEPSAGPVISQGGAGSLPAGDYASVVTFGNQDTFMESNPSPSSNVLTLAANKEINYTSIPVSDNGFVNMRRIWRTLENQALSEVYFLAGRIDDNFTTTFTEDLTVIQLGGSVSFNNGLPPEDLKVGVIWNERLFATDGKDLFYSEFLLPECFGEESILPVFPDDLHEIVALHPYGDRLIIGKTNKIHFLIGNTRSSFAVHTLDDTHGVKSHHSMQSAEGALFWYGSGKAVYRSDGVTSRDISTPKVAPILEKIPDVEEENIVGAIYARRNWYVLSVPQEGEGSGNRVVLVYNYKYDTWTTFRHPAQAPAFLGRFFNEDEAEYLLGSFTDNHLYQMYDETYKTDFGNIISSEFLTKADDYGAPGWRKALDQFWLAIPQVVGGSLQIQAIAEKEGPDHTPSPATIADRTVSLWFPQLWKPYKVPTWRNPATRLQLRVVYAGKQPLDIEGLHFDIGLLPRRPGRAS